MTGGLQAIVFDFDGVIADSEPLHLRAFQEELASEGIPLSPRDYYARYLGYDDAGVFEAVSRDRGLNLSTHQIAALVARKGHRVEEMIKGGAVLFPGAAEFVRQAAATVPIAIASGAQRHEIDDIVAAAGLATLFTAIVAAGDTPNGKPSPDPYALAFRKLREHAGNHLSADRCIAIEDSRWGLESARGAGLRCVGVTNSYPASELPGAELIVGGLNELSVSMLDDLVRSAGSGVAGPAGQIRA